MFVTMKKFKVRIALRHHIISASLLCRADLKHQADGEFPRKICFTEKIWVQKMCGCFKQPQAFVKESIGKS